MKQRHLAAALVAARSGVLRWRMALLSLLALLAALGGVLYAKSEHIVLGAEAYVYGYPLVIMDLTRARAVQTVGPENQLQRIRQFPDARFKNVVRPNVDTLYTTAFIDMAEGPWVFEMAPNNLRYELMPFMDAWTNVFASPGTRTTGTGGGTFLLVGPGWQGQHQTRRKGDQSFHHSIHPITPGRLQSCAMAAKAAENPLALKATPVGAPPVPLP